jgi:PmbA protein
VQEITIAGHLRTMFSQIAAVGADVYAAGSKSVGSILVERMTIAGH